VRRLVVAVLTKFDESGKLSLDESYADFLRKLVDSGVDTVMVAGSNGEFHAMNEGERKELAEFAVGVLGNDRILVHAGGSSFFETLKIAEHALSLGVREISVVTPYYFPYDQKAIEDYYVSLAKALPNAKLIIYNIPSFTGNRIQPETIMKIVEKADNVIGLKDTDNRPWIAGFLKNEIPGFVVFSGNDYTVADYNARGADGAVSGSANLVPRLLRKILDSIDDGKTEAFDLQRILDRFVSKVSGHTAFVAANKFVLRERGYDVGFPRKPSRDLMNEERKELRKVIGEFEDWLV